MSGTSSGTMPVEIIQTVSRKRWTSEQKLRMVEETFQPGNSVSQVARENGISPAMLYKWRGVAPNKTDKLLRDFIALTKGIPLSRFCVSFAALLQKCKTKSRGRLRGLAFFSLKRLFGHARLRGNSHLRQAF